MPRKKKTSRTASTPSSNELAAATDLLGRAEALYPSLLKQRDALRAKLEQLDGMLSKLRAVTGAAAAPSKAPAAKAPAAPKAPKAKGKKRGPRRPRGSGPSLSSAILTALAKGSLSSADLYEAVVAQRPGTSRAHLHTELFQLGRKGSVKRSGQRGSFRYSAA